MYITLIITGCGRHVEKNHGNTFYFWGLSLITQFIFLHCKYPGVETSATIFKAGVEELLSFWPGIHVFILTRCVFILTRYVFISLFNITPGWMHYTFFSFSDSEIVCSIFRKPASWSSYLELKVISPTPRKERSKSWKWPLGSSVSFKPRKNGHLDYSLALYTI